MRKRRWIAVMVGGLLVLSGCARTVTGAAIAGASASTPEVSTTVSTDGGSTESSSSSSSSDTPTTVSSASLTMAPIPPVDPTRETPLPDPGTVQTTATAPGGDPLAAPPFQGSVIADPTAYPGLVTTVGFQTPSGNIACGFYDDGVACQIADYTFDIPAKPEECGDTGWGFNFGADDQGGFMFCAGDVEGGGPPLAYGQQLGVGDFHCVSQESGVTCIYAPTGGGFSLSRDAFELF